MAGPANRNVIKSTAAVLRCIDTFSSKNSSPERSKDKAADGGMESTFGVV
jgi:hypothetical protein